jgi:hypothetical protein
MPRTPPAGLDEKKATQVAARFLSAAGRSMHHLKLVKLIYLLDREALLRWGLPVTNDVYFSLPHGPVPSGVLDLILSEDGFWAQHISGPHEYVVTLQDETGNDELSEAEEALIDELSDRYRTWDRFKLRDYTHTLPEWENPGSGRLPIRIEDILKAGGKSPEQIEAIKRDVSDIQLAHARFSSR